MKETFVGWLCWSVFYVFYSTALSKYTKFLSVVNRDKNEFYQSWAGIALDYASESSSESVESAIR